MNFKSPALVEKTKGRRLCGGRCCPCRPAFCPRTRAARRLSRASAAGCAILHAPPPCLSTGGRIGCDRRSRFPLPTVCLLVRDHPHPPPYKRARRLAYLHTPASTTPRHRCTCPHLPIRFRAYAQSLCLQILCRSAIDFAHPRPRAVALAGAFDAVVAAVKSRGLPPEPQRDSSRVALSPVVGTAVFLMRSEPFSPTPRRPPGRATLKPRPIGPRDARHIAWCVRLLRVVGAS